MNYKEEYNKLIEAIDNLLKVTNPILSEIVNNINNKDYLSAYDKLQSCIEEMEEYRTQLVNVLLVLKQLKELGKPLPELQMNKAVKCSYTEPQENTSCSTCINACKLTDEDMDFIVCNICNQAVKAIQKGYSKDEIMDAFVVHPEGQCKQHVHTDEIPYLEDLVNPDTEEPLPEIPPEAEEGFVDEDHMEPEPNNP